MHVRRAYALLPVILWLTCATSWGAFGYNSPVTIHHAQIPSTQTDFPVLISVTDARLKDVAHSGHVQSASGYDIRPYSDSGCTTALTYELERYTATSGELVMWVKISSLSSSVDTIIYLGYGDASLTTDGSSTSTWSNNYFGVYHLADGTTLNVNSATGSNNGTNHSATATSGQVDGGTNVASASTQYIDLGTGFGLEAAAMTVSAWVNATSFPNAPNAIFSKQDGTNGIFSFAVNNTGKLNCFVRRTSGGSVSNYDGTGSHTLSSSTWYYVTMVYDSSIGLAGYVNAASDGTNSTHGFQLFASAGVEADIGRDPIVGTRNWNGKIDQMTVSSVGRSADWITTEYNNQVAPGTFETLETEVSGCAPTPTATATFTPTPTATATFTPTPSATFTPTPTATFTPTPTATNTPTPTPSATATSTPTPTPSELSYAIPE